jgi:hypothetical protein
LEEKQSINIIKSSTVHSHTHPPVHPLPHPQTQDLSIWYGPDTYMGHNLEVLLRRLSGMSDKDIQAVHPAHTQVHTHTHPHIHTTPHI